MDFYELLKGPGPVILDGGMGTMLQARGLGLGEHPELAALEHRDWIFTASTPRPAVRSCAPIPLALTGKSCGAPEKL